MTVKIVSTAKGGFFIYLAFYLRRNVPWRKMSCPPLGVEGKIRVKAKPDVRNGFCTSFYVYDGSGHRVPLFIMFTQRSVTATCAGNEEVTPSVLKPLPKCV